MEPISNIDRLVALLRQRLSQGGAVRPEGPMAAGRRQAAAPDALRAMAELESTDDHRLRRALVQKLLSERLGQRLVNEARFQTIVERVTETLEADPEGRRLLAQVVADLRAIAR